MMTTMECEAMELRIGAWLDGELDAAEAREVAAHVEGCARCAAELASLRRLRAALRERMPPLRAPDPLRARLRAAAASAPAPAAAGGVPRWLALAASVAVLLAASGVAWRAGAAAERRDRLADELVAGHVRSLFPGHLMDVASTDQHTVKPWFDGRIDFAPPVHDLADRGFPLAGGRVDYLAGRPVASLVYGRRKHWINVFLWPADGRTAARPGTRRGYHLVPCGGAAMECWAVSDVSEDDLRQLVALLRRADPALRPQR